MYVDDDIDSEEILTAFSEEMDHRFNFVLLPGRRGF